MHTQIFAPSQKESYFRSITPVSNLIGYKNPFKHILLISVALTLSKAESHSLGYEFCHNIFNISQIYSISK